MEINDFVHGRIILPDIISKIVQTPHFQRLKRIHQLGLLYKVQPLANYTRYDHSIGTYYLASKMLTNLENNSNWYENISTNENDLKEYQFHRIAVEIAALLHDIGHGPFSHTWERIAKVYNHEENSEHCIDDIFIKLGPNTLPEFRNNNNYGIDLIKALILGDSKRISATLRPKYNFMFEIVHNNQCELDIDKLDYMKRDSFYANLIFKKDIENIGNQLDSIFFKARISDTGAHIEYRYEDYKNIYKLFEARNRLHVHFYRMPKLMACDFLLRQIISSGNYEIDGKPITEIRSKQIETFLKLVDEEVFRLISEHKLIAYLTNIERILEIDKLNEQSERESVFEVRMEVKGAGVQMPPDDNFHFYGDATLKGNIERDIKTKNLLVRFRLK